MNLLFESCSFLWLTFEPERIPSQVMSAFENPANKPFLSSISAWEITIKFQLGKLMLPEPPNIFLPAARHFHGISSLDLTEKDTAHLVNLPTIHKDPFDRIIICQAIENGLTILTPDEHIRNYPIKTLW